MLRSPWRRIPSCLHRLAEYWRRSRLARLPPPRNLTVATTARSTQFCCTRAAPSSRAMHFAHEFKRTAPRKPVAPTRPRPPLPSPHIVTIAIRPLCRAGCPDEYDNSEFRESKIFLLEGIDAFFAVLPVGHEGGCSKSPRAVPLACHSGAARRHRAWNDRCEYDSHRLAAL